MPRGGLWQGFWSLADPKISITSVACMVVGASVAATHGPIDWTWLGVLALALFGMEVGKNAWGDVFDFDSGTDLAVAPETFYRTHPVQPAALSTFVLYALGVGAGILFAA